jgi:hypothetical protein
MPPDRSCPTRGTLGRFRSLVRLRKVRPALHRPATAVTVGSPLSSITPELGCSQLHRPEVRECRMLHGSEVARYDEGGPNERSEQDDSSAAENSRSTAQGAATDRFIAQGSNALTEHETSEADSPGRSYPLVAMGGGADPLPVPGSPWHNTICIRTAMHPAVLGATMELRHRAAWRSRRLRS